MAQGVLERAPVGLGGGPPESTDRGGGNGRPRFDPTRFGLLAFLATVSMLFIGFTSAYMVRRASGDWRPIPPPAMLWANTALLLLSSFTLEAARRRLRDVEPAAARGLLLLTGGLGGCFVAGQWLAWRRLAASGVYLASNPHSSFFYVLTGLHAVHLLGGLAWLAFVVARAPRTSVVAGGRSLSLFATYWHFLGGLWLYVLLLLFVL